MFLNRDPKLFLAVILNYQNLSFRFLSGVWGADKSGGDQGV